MIEQVSQEVFKNTKGVSYSRLSKLAESPQAYLAALAEDVSTSAAALGSAVDIMLTEPDKFDEEIYVMTASKPGSDLMLKYVNALVETSDKHKAWIASGFKIGANAVETKFQKEGKTYYDALIAAQGRKILDAEELFKANQMVAELKANPYTKKYFVPEDGVELVFQARILWSLMYSSLLHEGKSNVVQAKSVLDVIRIDHKNKIVQPIELKTGAESFMKSYWRYKRYLQGGMYHTAAHMSMRPEDLDLYDVENIKFIYADSNLWYPPMIYQMTDNDLHVATNGSMYKIIGNNDHPNSFGYLKDRWRVKGYTQLAAELEWHQKMDKWDYSYDVYQKNGEVDIDAFTFKF